jgi:hypothetical protein
MLLSGLDQAAYPWYSNPASAARLRSDIERAMSAVADASTWEEAVRALHPSSFEQKPGTVGMLEIPIPDQSATTIKSRKKRN